MIYELCCLVNSDASEAEVSKVNEIISSSVKDFSAELVLEDNWGVKTLAQSTSSGKPGQIFSTSFSKLKMLI